MKLKVWGFIFMMLFVFCLLQTASAEVNIMGVYDTDWGEMEITKQLKSSGGSGDFIQGHFKAKGYQISGGLQGNVLKNGTWFVPRGGPSGYLELVFSSDGKSFSGKWRNKNSSGWDGNINGRRRGSGGTTTTTTTTTTAGGPENAVRAFFKAVVNKDYSTAWNGLSQTSKRTIVNKIAKAAKVAPSEVWPMMNNTGSKVSVSFWDGFRNNKGFQMIAKNARLGSASIVGNNVAHVPLTVGTETVNFKVYKEASGWKAGWVETFP